MVNRARDCSSANESSKKKPVVSRKPTISTSACLSNADEVTNNNDPACVEDISHSFDQVQHQENHYFALLIESNCYVPLDNNLSNFAVSDYDQQYSILKRNSAVIVYRTGHLFVCSCDSNRQSFVENIPECTESGCVLGYKALLYPFLSHINTQLVEQNNAKLKKLKSSLSFMTEENFMNSVKFFLHFCNENVNSDNLHLDYTDYHCLLVASVIYYIKE